MKTILNILWLLLSGLWMALAYLVFGVIACITIIGIPFGLAAFRIANYALWPFGRTVVRRTNAGAFSALGNLVWIIVAGLWLALGHLFSGILLCITIIGIPFGIANFKMIPVSLVPLGRQIVRTGQPYGIHPLRDTASDHPRRRTTRTSRNRDIPVKNGRTAPANIQWSVQ